MPYTIRYDSETKIISVELLENIDLQSAIDLITNISEIASQVHCYNFLSDIRRLDQSFSIEELYMLIRHIQKTAKAMNIPLSHIKRANISKFDISNTSFSEKMHSQLGIAMRNFSTQEQAEAWLMQGVQPNEALYVPQFIFKKYKKGLSVTFALDQKSNILEVNIQGQYRLEDGKEALQKALQLLKRHESHLVLADLREAHLELSVMDLYKIPEVIRDRLALSGFSAQKFRRGVVVHEINSNMRFLENLISNRAQTMKIFTNVDEAKAWLLHG